MTPAVLTPSAGLPQSPPSPQPVVGVARNGALRYAPDDVVFVAPCPGCGVGCKWLQDRQREDGRIFHIYCPTCPQEGTCRD